MVFSAVHDCAPLSRSGDSGPAVFINFWTQPRLFLHISSQAAFVLQWYKGVALISTSEHSFMDKKPRHIPVLRSNSLLNSESSSDGVSTMCNPCLVPSPRLGATGLQTRLWLYHVGGARRLKASSPPSLLSTPLVLGLSGTEGETQRHLARRSAGTSPRISLHLCRSLLGGAAVSKTPPKGSTACNAGCEGL